MVELLGLGNAVFLRGSNGCVIESCNWWDNDSFKPALFVGFVLIFPRISLPSTNRGNSMLSARMLATYISSFVVLAIVGCDRSGTAGNAPPNLPTTNTAQVPPASVGNNSFGPPEPDETQARPASSILDYGSCSAKEPVFSCTTTKGKFVEVCDAGKAIQYSYGKKGIKPEIALSVPRSAASTSQWDGFGSSMTTSIQIPNGGTVYEVFSSTNRMSDAHERTSGIYVEVNGKHNGTVKCRDETVVNNMEDIDLKPVPLQ